MHVKALLSVSLVLVGAPQARAQTYANPIDIDYRYNFEEERRGVSFRTGADPAIVWHKDAYYLFLTLADGYWRSRDLIDWTFVAPSRWPFDSVVAPAVVSDGDQLVVMPSLTIPGAILQSHAPETGRLDFLTRRTNAVPGAVDRGREQLVAPGELPAGPWDPALFIDDDGRWYLYYGSSNHFPLYGVRLDPDRKMDYTAKPTALFKLDPDAHGWERFGRDHDGLTAGGASIAPFLEGAWMTKVAGRYYLQYGAPGTEFNVYGNGTYVGESPMGPFRYAPYNPVAYKPGGFVWGAGHGSTFQDRFGNWWNSGTGWIGYNSNFERRITMSPARFYPDGQMAVSTRFGDLPHWVPQHRNEDPEALFTGWMLLSYRSAATASSALDQFGAALATDENPRSFWVARSKSPGEWLQLDLGQETTIRAVQVNFADYRSGRYADAHDIYTEFELQHSRDGKQWQRLAATGTPRRDRPNAYFELPAPVRARFVRYVHGHVGAAHLAIADLRVFGSSGERRPAAPVDVKVKRLADSRNAAIAWKPVPGAVGYNILWGIRPDRLTLSYQVYADELADPLVPRKELRALNAGQKYFVAIEAFNRSGVSRRSKPLAM